MHYRTILLFTAAVPLLTGLADGQTASGSNPAASGIESFAARSKKPADWLTWDTDLRVRDEYFHNANMKLLPGGASNEYNQLRTRIRAWTTVTPLENVEVNARLTWESRYYSRPTPPVPAAGYKVDRFEPDEVVPDTLNLRFKQLAGAPLTLTVGRQDLFLGNGWIFCEGTPRDGSRTIYLDAARLTLNRPDLKTEFNLIGISQNAAADAWLPPIHRQDFRSYVTEHNERALVLYAINKSIPQTQIDGYFIWKHDDRLAGGVPGGVSYGGDIIGAGARVATDLNAHWKLRSEFLPEVGHKNGLELRAFGINNRLSYFLLDPLNNNLRLGYEFLSGDNQSTTGRNERFDPLWGRWPQYSELFAYNPTVGPNVFEYGNLHRLNLGWSCNPTKKLEFTADYHALFAVQHEPFNVGGKTYRPTGNFRGHLAVAQMECVYNAHLKGHIRAEAFFPGDYYTTVPSGPTKAMETFLRTEILVTW